MTYVETWYAVLEQGDRGPAASQYAELFGELDRAIHYLDTMDDGGGEYQIYCVKPVPESDRWVWTIGIPGKGPTFPGGYVNEQAARNSRPHGHDLLKRRRGSHGPWITVISGADETAERSAP